MGDGSDGVYGSFVDFAVPSKLCEPGVVIRVDFCEPTLCEWYFAVIAEVVGVDGEVVFRGRVGIDVIFKSEAEAAADIAIFDDGPASKACIEGEERGINQAMKGVGDNAGEVTAAAT